MSSPQIRRPENLPVRESEIRAYRSEDEAELLSLWSRSLPFDPVDERTFRRKVLLDPNFNCEWLPTAHAGGKLVGFCLCLIRRVPLDKVGLEPERGWITAMGVSPEHRRHGVGTSLLDRALQLFAEAGRREVLIAPYTPNYFVPGVDVNRYADGVAFFEKHGFATVSRPLSMDANLVTIDLEPYRSRQAALLERGVSVRSLEANETPALMSFLSGHMPGDWVRHARDVLIDLTRGIGGYEQFTIAVRGREILGYCQFEGEHFGPFGVREGLQGQGIGTVLMAHCLETMRRRGLHNAWVLWTSDEAAERVYGRFGFHETRRFAVMRRTL